jgi:predicted nuclease of predicted toxin-antitoxin system
MKIWIDAQLPPTTTFPMAIEQLQQGEPIVEIGS